MSLVRGLDGPTLRWSDKKMVHCSPPTPHWSDNCWNTCTKVCCFLRDMIKRKNSSKTSENAQLSKQVWKGFTAYSVLFVNSVIPISLYFPILTRKIRQKYPLFRSKNICSLPPPPPPPPLGSTLSSDWKIYNWQYEPARLPLIFRKLLGISSSPLPPPPPLPLMSQISDKIEIVHFGPF